MVKISGDHIDDFLTSEFMNDPELKKYSNDVDYYAQSDKDYYFGNKGELHAAIVLEKLFKYSNNEIRIYSGGLNGPVSNSKIFKDALQEFIVKSDTKLFLLHSKNAKLESLGYDFIKENSIKSPDRVKIAIATHSFEQVISRILGDNLYFTLGDNKKFRIETAPEKLEAIVNFNSKQVVRVLSKAFDEELTAQCDGQKSDNFVA